MWLRREPRIQVTAWIHEAGCVEVEIAFMNLPEFEEVCLHHGISREEIEGKIMQAVRLGIPQITGVKAR